MRRSVLILCVLGFIAVLATTATMAGSQRPDGCQRCGNEFKGVDFSSCGLLIAPVDAYRANGQFIARFDNRCFACTSESNAFCTVDAGSSVAESLTMDDALESHRDEPGEAVAGNPCAPGQCKKSYRECLVFCSKNPCIISCEDRLQICLDQPCP